MVLLAFLLATGLGVLGATATGRPGSAAACKAFALTTVSDVKVTGVSHFDANASVVLSNLFSFINTTALPAFCRVELVITTNTTAGSFANTEVWLPDDWNGRMLSVGNGGLAGGVNVGDLGNTAVRQGFAGMSTDTGHNSSAFDGSWGLHNDNALIDFGFRAMHLSVLAGKAVIEEYYHTAPKKSYYFGCSTGGRQGLKEVQEYPGDFDGVVVGSPANWMTHLPAWGMHMNQNVLPANSSRFMTQEQWLNVIAPEVLRQCDALDGLTDGIINEPRACRFRPETLACRPGQNASTCLKGPQIEALHRIYSDYVETNQEYVFGSYYPGGELQYGISGYASGITDPISLPLIQNFVVNDTAFTVYDYNHHILKLLDEVDAGQANAIKTNLTGFVGPAHNGKIIQFVGWADQVISPGNSLHYYETVHAFMNQHTMLDIDDYYRLFPVPTMYHCSGGVGATSFGQDQLVPIAEDAEHNIVSAIVRWVEEGVAPVNFTAAKFNNDNPANGVNFTRPICMYPSSLVFRGGNSSDLSNFECTTLV